jgi:hypothetical protein
VFTTARVGVREEQIDAYIHARSASSVLYMCVYVLHDRETIALHIGIAT